MNTYGTWYPPVQQTLICLSKLYRTVEHKVFAGLAQDAIAACTAAVQVRCLCSSWGACLRTCVLPPPLDQHLAGCRRHLLCWPCS